MLFLSEYLLDAASTDMEEEWIERWLLGLTVEGHVSRAWKRWKRNMTG